MKDFHTEYGVVKLPDTVDMSEFNYLEFRSHIEYFLAIGASFYLNEKGQLEREKTPPRGFRGKWL